MAASANSVIDARIVCGTQDSDACTVCVHQNKGFQSAGMLLPTTRYVQKNYASEHLTLIYRHLHVRPVGSCTCVR